MLRHLKGRDLYVESAGVQAGELDPMAVQVMAELGITLGDHQPRSFEEFAGQDFDLVVALSQKPNSMPGDPRGTGSNIGRPPIPPRSKAARAAQSRLSRRPGRAEVPDCREIRVRRL